MRLALGVEYDGSGFSGWQRLSQAGALEPDGSLQTALEIALSKVANTRIDTICAGRTDAGVHARCQVVHFDSDVARALQINSTDHARLAVDDDITTIRIAVGRYREQAIGRDAGDRRAVARRHALTVTL